MKKKLLASLMAGVMLVSQGTSLSAARPNQRFWAECKNFAEGVLVGGVGAGLAGAIAYLLYTCNTPGAKVVNMEFPHATHVDHVDNVYKNLQEGKIVKLKMDRKSAQSIINSLGKSIESQRSGKHVDLKVIFERDEKLTTDDCKVNVTLKLTKKSSDRLEFKSIVAAVEDDK